LLSFARFNLIFNFSLDLWSLCLQRIFNLPSAISHQPSSISHHPSSIIHLPSYISLPTSSLSHQPSAIIHQPSSIIHHTSSILHLPSYLSQQNYKLQRYYVKYRVLKRYFL